MNMFVSGNEGEVVPKNDLYVVIAVSDRDIDVTQGTGLDLNDVIFAVYPMFAHSLLTVFVLGFVSSVK